MALALPCFPGMLRFRTRYGLALVTLALAGCHLSHSHAIPADPARDERIRAEVTARLAREPSVDADRIRVSVDRGMVVLHGSVDGIGAWKCALTSASLAPGVRVVVDYLVLERGPRDVRCLAPRPDTGVVTPPGP